MIGLFFYAVIILWLCFAVWLANKILIWLNFNKWKSTLKVMLTAFIFFLPVIDEIIAYPQMQALCEQSNYKLVVPEKDAFKKDIYYTSRQSKETLWPFTVVINKNEIHYVDSRTKKTILLGVGFNPVHGFLHAPAGSSGDRMPLILKNCQNIEQLDENGIPIRFKHLNLNIIPTP